MAHEVARANAGTAGIPASDSLWLNTDVGPSFYLLRDGRVMILEVFESTPREATPDEWVGAVVLGAKHYEAPELLELLPERPVDGRDCDQCVGSRWWTLPTPAISGAPIRIICPSCAGRGWTR